MADDTGGLIEARSGSRTRWWGAGAAADAVALALAGTLAHRLLFGAGYGLARDMVFTPQQPLNRAAIGVASAAPRAVPVDGVLALLTTVVDGAWVGRVAVLGVLTLAGAGAHRLAGGWGLAPRLVAAGFAVWNPFVVERLALGQWSLLAAYAPLPWLVVAVRRCTDQGVTLRRLAPVVGWTAFGSLTPTGGALMLLAVLVLAVGRPGAVRLGAVAAVLQVPWIVASLASSAAGMSDPAAVAAFAARSERPGGAALSLLGLGGIWDAGSTPTSRAGPLGYLTTITVVVAVAVGWPLARRALGAAGPRLALLAAAGLVVAVASSLPGGRTVVTELVRAVPGAGLLRDAQKWLLPFVLVAVLCAAGAVARLLTVVRASAGRVVLTVAAAVTPLLLLPDAVATTDRALTPSTYPRDFAEVARRVHDATLATLPFESYRRFGWGHATSVADPASRWFDAAVVTSDELVVGGQRLRGEDPWAAAIASGLRAGRPAGAVLAAAGVRWALLYRDAPGARTVSTAGLQPVYRGHDLELFRVPGRLAPRPDQPGTAALILVVTADALVLLLILSAAGVGLRSGTKSLGAQRRAASLASEHRKGNRA